MTVVSRRFLWVAAVPSLLVFVSGCGFLNPGGTTDDTNTTVNSVFISVYNFQADGGVRVRMTYPDRDGSDTGVDITTDDGSTTIPAESRGSTSVAVDDITTNAENNVSFRFTFPDADNEQFFVEFPRGELETNKRVRFGVFGPDPNQVSYFVD